MVWVDDRRIARINSKYLHHQGATDIITFNYGNGFAEIFVSLDTIKRQAPLYQQTFEQELTLCLVHGILHLVGLNDKTLCERQRMRKAELRLIQKLNNK